MRKQKKVISLYLKGFIYNLCLFFVIISFLYMPTATNLLDYQENFNAFVIFSLLALLTRFYILPVNIYYVEYIDVKK